MTDSLQSAAPVVSFAYVICKREHESRSLLPVRPGRGLTSAFTDNKMCNACKVNDFFNKAPFLWLRLGGLRRRSPAPPQTSYHWRIWRMVQHGLLGEVFLRVTSLQAFYLRLLVHKTQNKDLLSCILSHRMSSVSLLFVSPPLIVIIRVISRV